MTTYATVDDVATRLGRPISTPTEIAQVGAWLGDVEAIILARIPDLADLIDAGTVPLATVVMVEANAVVRKVLNPRGLRSSQRTVDDGTIQETVDSSQSDGALRLTDDEWDLLVPAIMSEAFSTRPGFEPDYPSPPPQVVWPWT